MTPKEDGPYSNFFFFSTQAYLELRILHLVVGLVQLRLEGTVGDSQGSVGHQHHGEFKLRHVLAWKKKKNKKKRLGCEETIRVKMIVILMVCYLV